MTDNIGEHMTDEELYAAQPTKDYEFSLGDRVERVNYRAVIVPNWIAKDGHWGDVYTALSRAADGQMATATEMIVKALERAHKVGFEEGRAAQRELGKMVEALTEAEEKGLGL